MGTIPIEPTSLTGSLPRGTTTAARPLVPEPAETLREDNQATKTRESRQPVSQPPVDKIKLSNKKIATEVRLATYAAPLATSLTLALLSPHSTPSASTAHQTVGRVHALH